MAKPAYARYARCRGGVVSRLTVRTFRPADLDAAAAILAAAHARARAAGPVGLSLGERFLSMPACRALLEKIVSSPRANSVVVESGGRVRGYLAGERQLFAPEDFASIYAEPRSAAVLLQGHAVSADIDAGAAYEAMYARVAEDWVAAGFFAHNVSVSALDRTAVDAWVNLGFGRKSVCAVRPTAEVVPDPTPLADISIEEIRGRDDEVLDTFHRRLMMFQTGPPMFWPYTGEADAKVRSVRRDAMLGGQGFAYVARLGGAPLGSLLFVPAVFLSPLLVCERMVYLWEGFVDETRRAAGVGSMLLAHAMSELRNRGIDWCALHYVSGNPRGGRFWPSKGFVAVEATLHRRVDERVAWAKGTPS
jgi:GNAT superfamily N-acetyltransferase